MEPKQIKTISLFTLISLAALLFILWLVDFSPFGIPEFIPGSEIRIYGILILIAFILIFIFLQKRLLKFNIHISRLKLVVASTIVAFVSLFVYQCIRQLFILHGQYSYNLSTVLVSSGLASLAFILLALAVSFELKKQKGIWRQVSTILLLILLFLAKEYFPRFEW